MGMITSTRVSVPVAEAAAQSAPAEARNAFNARQGAVAPVAATIRAEAVQQVVPKSGASDPQRLSAQSTVETSAAAAAEAAKAAYIRASIAAGINPLPLS